MIPYKTKRGQEAMGRLKVYDGVPPTYVKVSEYFGFSIAHCMHYKLLDSVQPKQDLLNFDVFTGT